MSKFLLLVKYIYLLFGKKFDGITVLRLKHRIYFSSASNTINGIPGSIVQKIIFGGVLHGVFASAVLFALYYSRGFSAATTDIDLISLITAHFWAYIGPPLIWYHEAVAQRVFYRKIKNIIEDPAMSEKISNILFSKLNSMKWIRNFRYAWIAVALVAYAYYDGFYKKFGITGWDDLWFYFIGFGVWILAMYTSIGVGRVLTSIHCVSILTISELRNRHYHRDNSLGLSFVTSFTGITAALFASGVLFFPLMFVLSQNGGIFGRVMSFGLIGISVLFVFLIYFVPVLLMAKKISLEKGKVLTGLYEKITTAERAYFDNDTQKNFNKFMFYNALRENVKSTNKYLLGTDVIVKFLPPFIITCFGLTITFLIRVNIP